MTRMTFGIDLHNRACMFFPMSRDGRVQELKGQILERLRVEVRGG